MLLLLSGDGIERRRVAEQQAVQRINRGQCIVHTRRGRERVSRVVDVRGETVVTSE